MVWVTVLTHAIDPKNMSLEVKNYVHKARLNFIEPSAQMSDLNPTEYLQDQPKTGNHARRPSNQGNLKYLPKKNGLEMCLKLVENQAKQLHTVIQQKQIQN